MESVLIKRYCNARTLALMLLYVAICSLSYYVAYEVRFDFAVPEEYAANRSMTLWWVVLLKFSLLLGFGQFESVLAYFRLPDVVRLFSALSLATLFLVVLWYAYGGDQMPPRGVILIDLLISFYALTGFRLFVRIRSSRELGDWLRPRDAQGVLVVGAGEVGSALAAELLHKARFGMRPVAFLDDDARKVGRFIHGIPVSDRPENLGRVARKYGATKVVIAFPSASSRRVREVAAAAQDEGMEVEIVPAMTDLVRGRARVTELRPVQMEDLLGRDPVEMDCEPVAGILGGRTVLVTGAGGSIGSELVRQILAHSPARVVVVDQAEFAVFELRENVLGDGAGVEVEQFVADVKDTERMEMLFAAFRPEVVFHAAAHKHVSLMESQPREALRNNFIATAGLARIASRHQTERFILISSDKAINPTSVMGATKRLAELALAAVQAQPGNRTRFMAVRFGNVLGSSGSVIPIFRRQIAAGGPLTVTDPEVTRFFMTVSEAVGLVLQCAALGEGGEIFVLDMGESIRILDVARQMIALSGLREGEDIEIVFTGLKPGEKRFEEVQHAGERLAPTHHPRILRFLDENGERVDLDSMERALGSATAAAGAGPIKQRIRDFVPEYTPYAGT